jgi:Cytochrome c554 and c-prime
MFWSVWVAALLFNVVALNLVTFGRPPKQNDSAKGQQASPRNTPPAKGATPSAKLKTVPRSEYVSDSTCARCHEDKFASYEQTAHHLTSQMANKNTIAGTFDPSSNTMTTASPNLTFQMDEKSGEFFETAIWGGPGSSATVPTAGSSSNGGGATRTRTERLELVIGSGGKGQTYLYWRDDQLFQLPVGYSTLLHRWTYSPGYEDGVADFERPIIPRCLECHATYFQAAFPDPQINIYDTKTFELGISCARCHGPERKHVARYQAGNLSTLPDDIVNPAKLSGVRQSEICTQCHAGQGERELMPAFTYVPGQPLERYIDLGPVDSTQNVDVHGKQGMLLMKSRCYQLSSPMNCSTCHDVHKKEPGPEAMSQHCLACHKVQQSATHAKVGEVMTQNCVDCHMPLLESKVIYLNIDGKKIHPRLRSHWIRIYSPDELQ